MKRATKAKEVLLYLGIHITIFLLSSGLVGYGIESTEHVLKKWVYYPMDHYISTSSPEYMKIITAWILGIFGMVFGSLGITNVIKTLFIRKSR